jgi:hypothetical protein
MVGKFLVNSQLAGQLIKGLRPKDLLKNCCLVVKVKELIPIKTDVELKIEEFNNTGETNLVSEDDIRDNVHISLDTDILPFYFINGELIDFYLLK